MNKILFLNKRFNNNSIKNKLGEKMTTKLIKPKVGIFLMGSQRFRKLGKGCKNGDYETRENIFANNFIKEFRDIAEIVFNGIVYDRDDVEKSINSFYMEKIDCVICVFLSWSEDREWILFLRDMYDIPILLYLPEVPGLWDKDIRNEDNFVDFLAQAGLVGTLQGSGSIPRINRVAEIIVDNLDSAAKKIKAFIYASRARNKLRKAEFGLMSSYNEVMWSTYIDPYNIFIRIGPELHFISYNRLKKEIRSIDDKTASIYMNELSSIYHVESDVDNDFFLESSRASIGLASLIKKDKLDALILNDVDYELFETIGLRPGFYHPSINDLNAVLVPEGDLGAGTIFYVLNQITGKHINFVEPFYFNKEKNIFSAGHAGPQDYNDKKYNNLVRISRDIRFAQTSFKYPGAPFAWYRIPPGIKTFAHFSELNGNYKIVCFLAESLPGDHKLCSYSHSDFKPETKVTELFENIIKTGTTQHFAIVEGDVCLELEMFAKINRLDIYKY